MVVVRAREGARETAGTVVVVATTTTAADARGVDRLRITSGAQIVLGSSAGWCMRC